MAYYFLETRSKPGDPIVESMNLPKSYFDFDLGRKLPALKKPIRMGVSKTFKAGPDLLQGPYTYLVASDRLRTLFEELEPENVQVSPIDIYRGSQKIARYHFIQVLHNVDAIDWSASDIESYPDDKYSIVKVRKLVLNRSVVAERQAFRMEGLNTLPVVSEAFRRRALEAELSGMQFSPVSAFKQG